MGIDMMPTQNKMLGTSRGPTGILPCLSLRKLHPVLHLKGGICVQQTDAQFSMFPPEN